MFYARASDVVTSLIDGRVVLEDGRPIGLDEADILREIGRALPRWRERLRRHGSTAVVMPGTCPGC